MDQGRLDGTIESDEEMEAMMSQQGGVLRISFIRACYFLFQTIVFTTVAQFIQ